MGVFMEPPALTSRAPRAILRVQGAIASSDVTAREIAPGHIAIDWSTLQETAPNPDPLLPPTWTTQATIIAEGHIPAGSYTVRIDPAMTFSPAFTSQWRLGHIRNVRPRRGLCSLNAVSLV